MNKPIIILGCGPAGLLAALAALQSNFPVIMISHKRKSNLGGAQFLHRKIPDLGEPDGHVHYIVRGDAGIYRQKVYQDTQVDFVSFENVKDGLTVSAWNLRRVYDELWENFSDNVMDMTVTPSDVIDWLESDQYTAVISTIPARDLCLSQLGWIREDHKFFSQRIRIYPEAIMDLPDNTIYYDGTQDHSWYRCSNLFDIGQTEYPEHIAAIVSPLIEVRKPVFTNCSCFMGYPNFLRLGRYGTWSKGQLSHDAYFGTWTALHEL
jgi:hypothetical protein